MCSKSLEFLWFGLAVIYFKSRGPPYGFVTFVQKSMEFLWLGPGRHSFKSRGQSLYLYGLDFSQCSIKTWSTVWFCSKVRNFVARTRSHLFKSPGQYSIKTWSSVWFCFQKSEILWQGPGSLLFKSRGQSLDWSLNFSQYSIKTWSFCSKVRDFCGSDQGVIYLKAGVRVQTFKIWTFHSIPSKLGTVRFCS